MSTTVLQLRRAEPDDPALLERFRNGDPTAFDQLVVRHRRVVYLVARRLLRSHEEADEAAQLAFIRAWKARQQFRGDSALRTWLTRIVLNVAKTMRSNRVPVDGLDSAGALEDPGDGADERVRREQLRARVRGAVAGLPDRQREVVTLKVFSEMTYREVAEVMGLSEGSIKAHLHQAVSNLRRLMASKD